MSGSRAHLQVAERMCRHRQTLAQSMPARTCVQMSRLEIDHCVFSLGVKSSVQARCPRCMAMVHEASGRSPPGISSPAGVCPLPYCGQVAHRGGAG